MKKSIKKGDVVKHYASIDKHPDRAIMPDLYGRSGIIISVKKKEVSRNRSKHVIELVIAHTADIMWDNGMLESNVPIETLEVVSKAK